MIVAHLADLHLGYRAHEAREGGAGGGAADAREEDVAEAFRAAVREILRVRPSLVLLAGDVFDRADPPPTALVVLARGLETLRASLPETPVVIAAGARDTPGGSAGPGVLSAFDTVPQVEAATGIGHSVRVEALDAHVFLLPHAAATGTPPPVISPDPDARWNLLVGYGRPDDGNEGPPRDTDTVRSGSRPFDAAERGREEREITIDPTEWDYVALGGAHGFRRVSPRVVCAGSLERVGPEPWGEAHRAKGFVVADLEGGDVELHEVPGRPVVSLAPIGWDPRRPNRVNERIRELSREVPGGVDGKVVRLRLEGMGPDELKKLDRPLLADLRRRAIHLAVEVVPPDEETPPEPIDALTRVRARLGSEADDPDALLRDVEAILEGVDRPRSE